MVMTYTPPASVEEATELPVDRLALHLLRRFAKGSGQTSRNSMYRGAVQAYSHNGVGRNEQAAALHGLVEAYDWLCMHGLLAVEPESHQSGSCYITERGQQVLTANDGLALVQAQKRLDIELHPRIAGRVRSQFMLGEYELAVLAALREVEIRVRELAGASDSDIGVKLMRQAFGGSGPLADPSLDGGERDAISALFAGAIGVFKNPSSHRQVEYADPTVDSEIVLLGDLLLRMLDATAARLSVTH